MTGASVTFAQTFPRLALWTHVCMTRSKGVTGMYAWLPRAGDYCFVSAGFFQSPCNMNVHFVPFIASFYFHLYLFTTAQNINYLNTSVQFLVFSLFHTFHTLIIIITSAVESANYQQSLSWRTRTSRCEPALDVRLIYRATPLRFRSILLRYLRSLKP